MRSQICFVSADLPTNSIPIIYERANTEKRLFIYVKRWQDYEGTFLLRTLFANLDLEGLCKLFVTYLSYIQILAGKQTENASL